MSIDIVHGDILVVGVKEYPIKAVADWADFGTTSSFQKLATTPCSTLRPAAIVAGRRGDPEPSLSNLFCTPLDPVDSELRQRLAIETPHELLQTFIANGDGFIHIIIEDLKRT